MKNERVEIARPFVKWVGGKTQLLDEIQRALPKDFSKMEGVVYVEPFVGGGAVLFWILQNYPNITKAVINDINPELICTYKVIRNQVDDLILKLKQIQSEYIPLPAEDRKNYYLAKRTLFNSKNIDDVTTAALFIFLNRTCFNGLYRVNSKGEFNVPHGKYANPKICDESNLIAVSKLLQNVEILCGDYSQTLKYAGENTLYYCDPPYKPITETSAFTSYTKEGFSDLDQIKLKEFYESLGQKGAYFIASNSDPSSVNPNETFFDKLYNNFSIKRVSASRMVNSRPEGRGAISEIMISNIINA